MFNFFIGNKAKEEEKNKIIAELVLKLIEALRDGHVSLEERKNLSEKAYGVLIDLHLDDKKFDKMKEQ